jgi:hypothetical protein
MLKPLKNHQRQQNQPERRTGKQGIGDCHTADQALVRAAKHDRNFVGARKAELLCGQSGRCQHLRREVHSRTTRASSVDFLHQAPFARVRASNVGEKQS